MTCGGNHMSHGYQESPRTTEASVSLIFRTFNVTPTPLRWIFKTAKRFFKKSLSCRVCLLNSREWRDRWKKTSDQVWRASLRLSGSDERLPHRFSLNVYSYSKYTRDSFKSSLLKVFCNNSLLCIAKSIPQLSILSHLPTSSHAVKAQCFKIRLGPLFWNETTLKWHKKEGLIRPTRCSIKRKL